VAISFIQSPTPAANSGGDSSAISQAFGSNVQAGSLIVVQGAFYEESDTPVAGNCTKSAGTATISTPTLDSYRIGGGSPTSNLAMFSARVLTGGSLTMQVQSASGSFRWKAISVAEYGGSWDESRLEDESNNNYNSSTSTADSGNGTSVGAALFVGSLCVNSPGNPVGWTRDAAFSLASENQDGSTNDISQIYRIVSSGTTDSATWTSIGFNTGAMVLLAVYREVGASTPIAAIGGFYRMMQGNN
jgi:hypothetical protein